MGALVEAPLALFGAIQSGNAAAAQGQARSDEIKRDAQLAKVAATESSASRLEDLNRTIGAITALTAQRNLNPNDPSGQAAVFAAQRASDRDVQRTQFNARQGYSNAQLAARAAQMGGNAAATSYYLGGAGNFLKSLDSAAASFASAGG